MSKDLLVNYNDKPCYNIHLRDSFDDLGNLIKNELSKNYNKVCIVTDSNVEGLYLKLLSEQLKTIISVVISFSFTAGESSKNTRTVEKLYEELTINHFDRGDLLVALGGGVVGDLTGFAAATYMRGIDFIQVPTTLLSQVDSSIGGKTGVDFLSYKNMVGAFYMPKMVYMNLSVLKSLPEDQFACGMGEIIKHGLIRDKNYFYWLIENNIKIKSLDFNILEEMIYKSCVIKKETVEIDPTEKGIRAHLNFGHTLGHAIEKLMNFNMFHGQCVGVGMIAASYLSMKCGYISSEEYNEIINANKLFDLPINVNGLSTEDILLASKSDKKMVGNKVKFVYLKEIGCADINTEFTDEDLIEALEQVVI